MKKAISIYITILAVVFIFANIALVIDMVQMQVIFLIDGSTIETEEAWEVADEFFYEENGELYSIDSEYVERIGGGNIPYILGGIFAAISMEEPADELSGGSTSPAVDNYLEWIKNIIFLAILGGVGLAVFNFIQIKKRTRQRQSISGDSIAEKRKDFNDMEKIVDFFLNLFKIQLDADKGTEATFLPVVAQSSSSSTVYELRVKNNGDWTSRRMTIGALAEDSGSKSKCFVVTYDDRLVVKIPPLPIEDFETYLESISEENRIVEQLSPKQCIIPRVSVVLKRIPATFDGMGWAKEEIEAKSIERLKKFPKYHKHLMIDGSFVFFMDLSKYYFLGNIIREIHEVENKVFDEITGHPDIIWEPDGYERRYCSEGDDPSVCTSIHEIFDQYQNKVKPILSEYDLSILPYQIQSWFLIHLGGQNVPDREKGVSREFVNKLNSLLKKIMEDNPKAVEAYRKAIKDYIRKTSFSQHRAQIESIITNLLELLAWLGEKKVAMRDLKPDNLLVAGDPSKYPNFLTTAEEFEIGLIDVETAVILKASGRRGIEQPMLAGTPLYATPSHLFTNDILQDIFDDLASVLHYQDWHAMMAIIYNVITGEPLFNQTAKLLPTIRNAMQKSMAGTKDFASVLKDVSRLFWQSATDEFKAKTSQYSQVMKEAEVMLPENAIEMLRNQIVKEIESIDGVIREIVYSQNIFTSESIRKQLLDSKHGKIRQFKEKIEKQESSLVTQLADKDKTLTLLEDIERLKLQKEKSEKMKKVMERSQVKLTASQIVEFMFGVVSKAMYSAKWAGGDTVGVPAISEVPDSASTIQATIEE